MRERNKLRVWSHKTRQLLILHECKRKELHGMNVGLVIVAYSKSESLIDKMKEMRFLYKIL